ncbi:hypothetical protein QTI51_36740 [Variovorax sp. J22G73]|uniref:hypothetical protein n=1 Tax=unclassified Variovorax TaxID=663243 RepID=UPI002578AED3|nr:MULTISPECIES: hypothetical protein [unclassified Variovorax]MDM0010542.1 hypothetical protein [Variovorax sp. J22R203]MDM0102876.1 hypothetical protein [Variovorax sp. J22G73]
MRAFIRSLQNKRQDIGKALARQDFLSPKWYAYELGIQVEDTEREFELYRRSVPAFPAASDANKRIENLFSAIRGELERLRNGLVEQKLEAAEESLVTLCSLLAQLDVCLEDA